MLRQLLTSMLRVKADGNSLYSLCIDYSDLATRDKLGCTVRQNSEWIAAVANAEAARDACERCGLVLLHARRASLSSAVPQLR